MLTLQRAYLPDDSGTFGRLTVNDNLVLFTLEPPWRGNQRRVSCIPEGLYSLQMRESPVVRRSTAGEYFEGWEVANVLDRDFIMFHPGNWVRDTDGCILVGTAFSWHAERGPMITDSRAAFRRFMLALTNYDFWDIKIVNIHPQFP